MPELPSCVAVNVRLHVLEVWRLVIVLVVAEVRGEAVPADKAVEAVLRAALEARTASEAA